MDYIAKKKFIFTALIIIILTAGTIIELALFVPLQKKVGGPAFKQRASN